MVCALSKDRGHPNDGDTGVASRYLNLVITVGQGVMTLLCAANTKLTTVFTYTDFLAERRCNDD